MATLMAGVKGIDGIFYQKAVDWNRGKPVEPKLGAAIKDTKIAEVTRYFVVSRENGKRVQTGSFEHLSDATVELVRVQTIEKSRKLTKDFTRNVTLPASIDPAAVAPASGTWAQARAAFLRHLSEQRKGGNNVDNTIARYERSLRKFDAFLALRKITKLSDITPQLIRECRSMYIAGNDSLKWKGAPRGWKQDFKPIKQAFNLAVVEGVIAASPIVFMRETSGKKKAEVGSDPFTADEMKRLKALFAKTNSKSSVAEKLEQLMFLLLLNTGVRRGDAASLTWGQVNGRITLKANKNHKEISLPILADLQKALDAERARRNPKATDSVLLHPTTEQAFDFDGDRVYDRCKVLGKRAGIKKSNPHRYRDSFAAECFYRGCSTAQVAAYLGDTEKTILTYYKKQIAEYQDQADEKMLSGAKGLY